MLQGQGKEKERERNTDVAEHQLVVSHPHAPTVNWPITEACAVADN